MVTESPATAIQPLQNGDVLSHEEFWRIYREHHEIKRAEHINGIVYVPRPAAPRQHGHPHTMIAAWLGLHAGPRGLLAPDNSSVLLPNRQTTQPDLFLLAPDNDAVVTPERLEGVPDLVVEVAASSASYDLHVKKDLYEQSGVHEYVVWSIWDREVFWFRLDEAGQYRRVEPRDGLVESDRFPGLVLDVNALVAGDYATVFRHVMETPSGGG